MHDNVGHLESHDNAQVLFVGAGNFSANQTFSIMKNAGMLVNYSSYEDAIDAINTGLNPDIIVMDFGAADVDGFGLIKWFAEKGNCGVIVLSTQNDESNKIISLELGADDYIAKPAGSREFVARIRAVHRRVRRARTLNCPAIQPQAQALCFGSIRVNVANRLVMTQDGKSIPVTSAEFHLLTMLIDAKGQPVSRDDLCAAVLRRQWKVEDRSIDQLVFNLRRKLPVDHTGASLIHSIRGLGYLARIPDAIHQTFAH